MWIGRGFPERRSPAVAALQGEGRLVPVRNTTGREPLPLIATLGYSGKLLCIK